ncbi:uncharacterized protein MONOS_14746 [Monocercomonoides exilis]|uniref:uncharacterized protein n=1 Tax=Monocercomonoides exilis TaxID=2049356 RepID=UPI0035599485|nr:hypothetical protein MONOS_14746 [Monocercomonoides exilis]|eukprot:MONOS_14746.1-p1 / transcript=MONOS_14746.1 / gene=MONOS_14746 / organism=Monocercomonoides_exilis_PA203 / gene_product=unspecified product / transcript_product=unspecified product / location=Mono_scaffold01063:14974-15189(-) / protein_length=72 / sequence_SO=supercontig / SO=protein_coding / is_pseudo=false
MESREEEERGEGIVCVIELRHGSLLSKEVFTEAAEEEVDKDVAVVFAKTEAELDDDEKKEDAFKVIRNVVV